MPGSRIAVRRVARKTPDLRKGWNREGSMLGVSTPQPTAPGQAHLNSCPLENWLDVLRHHVDIGLPLRWGVGQVCVLL